ncbi:MAG TPA: class I adenylate-forming enzyme family protein, partial [Gemmataceae bacterium]|nr:class I adenylate-forming enzyme family protein [Gemmataceae bacterium]
AVGLQLEVGYGLTEASPIVSAGLASECPPGSSGRPLPGVEVRIGDDREILIRGSNVMRGYYRDADSTAAALKDGWLHTGDHGRLDADGFLFVTGRLKEALVTAAGETLYPEDVEPYYASPLFAEHCVTGLPGPHGNDVPTLFVVPAAPDAGEKELRRALDDLRAAAPPRFRVAGMVRVDGPLPRTALGKVRRRFLAQQIQTRGNLP